MLEAIDAAQESIYIEMYIWKDDAVGQEFQKRLARKAAEGVAVHVIFMKTLQDEPRLWPQCSLPGCDRLR